MRHSPWTWIPSLFVVGEIPVAVIAYVSLLMFLQLRLPLAMSSLYCGLLFVPWCLRGLFRERLRRLGGYRVQIQLLELAMVLVMIVVALGFLYRGINIVWLFLMLFIFTAIAAFHDLSSSIYYDSMLSSSERQVWAGVKMFFSQSAVVFTYGLMIMFVGALEVIYRNIRLPWSTGCYVVAGVLLLMAVYHLFSLGRCDVVQSEAFACVSLRERLAERRHWVLAIVSLFVLLLPQSLMFLMRVVFLLTPSSEGGLGCTLQDIAFAQGAVGVIGFSIGIVLGRGLLRSAVLMRPFWPMCVALGLSPAVYVIMVAVPPPSLSFLCVGTFLAQFLFGVGVPVCGYFVRYVSGERYESTVNYVFLPLVASVMSVPVALSGWLLSELGFWWYFVFDAVLAPVSWLVLGILRVRRKLQIDVSEG